MVRRVDPAEGVTPSTTRAVFILVPSRMPGLPKTYRSGGERTPHASSRRALSSSCPRPAPSPARPAACSTGLAAETPPAEARRRQQARPPLPRQRHQPWAEEGPPPPPPPPPPLPPPLPFALQARPLAQPAAWAAWAPPAATSCAPAAATLSQIRRPPPPLALPPLLRRPSAAVARALPAVAVVVVVVRRRPAPAAAHRPPRTRARRWRPLLPTPRPSRGRAGHPAAG
mmetsp:Transcript_32089/g.101110  ORF Transcript_32089/g.101110 Transcript_32089/m.101110 type:complete len:228 (-) Transcript_32089:532-1215(-)